MGVGCREYGRDAGHDAWTEAYDVLQTPHGNEAWRQFQRPDAPRLAVLDWGMPEMDGLELVGRIRCSQADRPP